MTYAPTLGSLGWHPAAQHPDLLAAPVAAAVQTLGIECFVAPIDPDLADTAAFCEAYQVPTAVSANCVVVAGRRADLVRTAACLVLATDRADVNRVIRRRLELRSISFARMDDATAQTGMEYGGITPIGLPDDWPILIDEAVSRAEWIVVGSGIRSSKIVLPGAAVAALPGAEVLPLAVR